MNLVHSSHINSEFYKQLKKNACQKLKLITTNHLEGWHTALDLRISRSKPNIFMLLNKLRNRLNQF